MPFIRKGKKYHVNPVDPVEILDSGPFDRLTALSKVERLRRNDGGGMAQCRDAMNRTREGGEQGEGMPVLLLVIAAIFFLHSTFNGKTAIQGFCSDKIYIGIEGAVKYPGVYPLCGDDAVTLLIERAGGMDGPYDLPAMLNDVPLESGIRLILREDNGRLEGYLDDVPAFYKVTLGIPISLNRESEEGLTAIPGIGPKLAGAIVKNRDKRGGFRTLSEIKEVPGIGDKTYKKILPYIEL